MEEQKKNLVSSFTPLLVILLIIASFVIGVLWSRVQNLEGPVAGATTKNTAPTAPTPLPAGNIKPISASDHIRGDKNAKVTLVEYSDFECPFCKSFHPTLLKILNDYDGKVRLVYRHFPLSFHANAQKEAEASECIASLGGNDKFWEFVDKIFERTISNGTGFALDKLGPLASEIGINQQEFQKCLDSGKFTALVAEQLADGQAGGITGTPGTFVIDSKGNKKIIPGALPYESVKASVESALK